MKNNKIIEKFQADIPFRLLCETYLDDVIKHHINPEIGFDSYSVEKIPVSEHKKIADKLHQHNIRITFHGPFIDLSPASPDPEIRKLTRLRFEQLARLIPVYKPLTIVCHTGYFNPRNISFKEKWFIHSLKLWTWLGQKIGDYGGKLMLENVFEYSPEDMIPLFENLAPATTGFCFDVGHQLVFSRSSFEIWMDSLGKYMGEVHLHDNMGVDDDHLILGKGVVNLDAVFRFLETRKDHLPVLTLETNDVDDFFQNFEYLKKYAFLSV